MFPLPRLRHVPRDGPSWPKSARARGGLAAAALLLCALIACGGYCEDLASPPAPPQVTLTVQPATPSLFPGQSLQFTLAVTGQTVSGVSWSALPTTGGTMAATGLFTASAIPGTYTITAQLNQNAQLTATTTLTILPVPPASRVSVNLIEAKGADQSGGNGVLNNDAIVGEPFQSQVSSNPSGSVSVRHGFTPP